MATALTLLGASTCTAVMNSANALRLTVTAASFDNTTNKVTLTWNAAMVSANATTKWNFSRGYVAINDTQVCNQQGAANGYLWTNSNWSNGTSLGSGTTQVSVTPGQTARIKLFVKGMWNYGYNDTYWNNGTATYDCYSNTAYLVLKIPPVVAAGVQISATKHYNNWATWLKEIQAKFGLTQNTLSVSAGTTAQATAWNNLVNGINNLRSRTYLNTASDTSAISTTSAGSLIQASQGTTVEDHLAGFIATCAHNVNDGSRSPWRAAPSFNTTTFTLESVSCTTSTNSQTCGTTSDATFSNTNSTNTTNSFADTCQTTRNSTFSDSNSTTSNRTFSNTNSTNSTNDHKTHSQNRTNGVNSGGGSCTIFKTTLFTTNRTTIRSTNSRSCDTTSNSTNSRSCNTTTNTTNTRSNTTTVCSTNSRTCSTQSNSTFSNTLNYTITRGFAVRRG